MKIRADVDKKFIRRFLFISVGCFLFMLWGLYDGLYTSPIELERSVQYKKLYEKMSQGDLDEDSRAAAWQELCDKNGWPMSKPKAPIVAQNYVYFQWFVFGIGLVLGSLFLRHYLKLLNAWIEADDSKVTTSFGQNLRIEDITGINKSKWAKKGIATVDYKDDTGSSKKMVFDDFKFDRKAMGKILSMAESNLSDDQIVGGTRESEKDDESSSTESAAVVSVD